MTLTGHLTNPSTREDQNPSTEYAEPRESGRGSPAPTPLVGHGPQRLRAPGQGLRCDVRTRGVERRVLVFARRDESHLSGAGYVKTTPSCTLGELPNYHVYDARGCFFFKSNGGQLPETVHRIRMMKLYRTSAFSSARKIEPREIRKDSARPFCLTLAESCRQGEDVDSAACKSNTRKGSARTCRKFCKSGRFESLYLAALSWGRAATNFQ